MWDECLAEMFAFEPGEAAEITIHQRVAMARAAGTPYIEVTQEELNQLRGMVRRPSKFRRLIWGLRDIVKGYWQGFLHWRKHELTEGAKSYRALEFAVLFVASAFLFEYCVFLFCRGIGR